MKLKGELLEGSYTTYVQYKITAEKSMKSQTQKSKTTGKITVKSANINKIKNAFNIKTREK